MSNRSCARSGSRISEKHGIELTAPQIQELAARRLEAILDPRAIQPSLMDELRRASGLPADVAPSEPDGDDSIDESALYASKSGFLNSIRRLFNLLNPKAIVDALNALSRKTKAVAAREAELRRRQTEWNALHFEILRRLVTDIARTEIDNQHLAHRVESLQARVDFNERRVRSLEHSQTQPQHQQFSRGRQPSPDTRSLLLHRFQPERGRSACDRSRGGTGRQMLPGRHPSPSPEAVADAARAGCAISHRRTFLRNGRRRRLGSTGSGRRGRRLHGRRRGVRRSR